LNGSFSHLAYVRFMKFSVAPESNKAGASVLRCAAWTYAFRVIDFRLDMYTFSEVFLSHAACASRSSTSSFWEVGSSVSLLCSLAESSASYSGVSGLFSGRSNVTDLVGVSDILFMLLVRSGIDSVSSFSDSSESHRVSLLVESSSAVGRGVVSGFRSFSKRFIQRLVGCSPPHSLHCSGGPMSSLIRSVYERIGRSSLCSTCCFRLLASVFVGELDCGVFTVRFIAAASVLREWSSEEVGVLCSVSCLARFFKAWASFFSDLVG